MFTPSTNLRLLNVPFSSDGLDTIYFGSLAEQQEYFNSKIKVNCGNEFNYVKKDNYIVVDGNPEQLYMVNYIMYMNENYSNKWFYAFVTGMEWASVNSTRLYFVTDPIQTWLFELQLYESFIVRQHSEADNVGDNIVPEPIGTNSGAYLVGRTYNVSPNHITIWATCDETGGNLGSGNVSRGMFQGAFPAADLEFPGGWGAASSLLESYVDNGVADGIVKIVNSYSPAVIEEKRINKYSTTCDGYKPRNNKLLSGAFCKCFLSCMGQEQVFNPENCKGDQIVLTLNGDDTSGTLLINVENYGMGVTSGTNYGASIINIEITYPEGTWAYNKYRNDYNLHSYSNALMVQQKESRRGYGLIRDTLSAGQSLYGGLTAGLIGAVAGTAGGAAAFNSQASSLVGLGDSVQSISETLGGYDTITQELEAMSESYNAPPTGNASISTPYFVCAKAYLIYGYVTPLNSLARAYDDFLTVYGYAQNKFAVPNLHARRAFTYIKVSELHAGGEVPDADMKAIKSLFTRGIYFWDPNATVGDFSQDNSVL